MKTKRNTNQIADKVQQYVCLNWNAKQIFLTFVMISDTTKCYTEEVKERTTLTQLTHVIWRYKPQFKNKSQWFILNGWCGERLMLVEWVCDSLSRMTNWTSNQRDKQKETVTTTSTLILLTDKFSQSRLKQCSSTGYNNAAPRNWHEFFPKQFASRE